MQSRSLLAVELLCSVKEPYDVVSFFFQCRLKKIDGIKYTNIRQYIFLHTCELWVTILKSLQELCNRIQDFLAKNTLATLTLLGQLIQKTPSWLPKLAEHSLFDHILKFIRVSFFSSENMSI